MRGPQPKSANGKIVFLNEFYDRGNVLFLYREHRDKYDTFRSFMGRGLKNNELCIYTFPHRSDKVNLEYYFGKYSNFHQFPIIDEKIKALKEGDIDRLNSRLGELTDRVKSEYNALRLLMDFGNTFNTENVDTVIDLETDIHENSIVLNAFNLNFLDQEIAEKFIKFHEKVIISTEDDSTVSFSLSSKHRGLPNAVPFNMLSRESVERCVKKSLDVIVLSMLYQEPMCGFDVIKAIVRNFGVLLSQGTVYPFLYSLENQGYLKAEIRSDNKTKMYIPTESGKRFIKDRIKEYTTAQKKILDLVTGDGEGVNIGR